MKQRHPILRELTIIGEYEVKPLVNEYGSTYGFEYDIYTAQGLEQDCLCALDLDTPHEGDVWEQLLINLHTSPEYAKGK